MKNRKSLVFLDDGVMKIVFGTHLKVIRPVDIRAPFNVQFFDKLFAESDVFFVTAVDAIDRAKFDAYAAELSGVESNKSEQAVATPQRRVAAQPPSRRPNPAPTQGEQYGAEPYSGSVFIKSNAKTTIIVDDLFTNVEIAEGVKKALAVLPDLAVNLSILDQDQVKKSSILRRLIDNGTFVPCTPGEALKMEEEHERRVAADEEARLDQWAPMVDSHKRTMDDNSERGRRGRIADPMDITDEFQQGRAPAMASSNEDTGLMSNLMEMLDEAPDERSMLMPRQESMSSLTAEIDAVEREVAAEPPVKRQLAPRPRSSVDPNRAARPIGRMAE